MSTILERLDQEAQHGSIASCGVWIADGPGLNRFLRSLAFELAEHVLPIFERRRPGDHRARAAVDAGQRFLRSEGSLEEAQAALDALSQDFTVDDGDRKRDVKDGGAAVEFVAAACLCCFDPSPSKALFGSSFSASRAREQDSPLLESRQLLHACSPEEEAWQVERIREWLKQPELRAALASIPQPEVKVANRRSLKPGKPVPKQRMEMSIADDSRFAAYVLDAKRPVVCFFHPGAMEPENLNGLFSTMDRALGLIIDTTGPEFVLVDDYLIPGTVKRECGDMKLPLLKVYRGGVRSNPGDQPRDLCSKGSIGESRGQGFHDRMRQGDRGCFAMRP